MRNWEIGVYKLACLYQGFGYANISSRLATSHCLDQTYRVGQKGQAVALMLELMSCFSSLPYHGPLSYRNVKSIGVVRYCRTLRAIKELMAKSGLDLDELALHSLRIFWSTTLTAGGDISEKVMKGERRWKSDADKAYTRTTIKRFEESVT